MLLNDQVIKLILKILNNRAAQRMKCGEEPNRSLKQGAMATYHKNYIFNMQKKKNQVNKDVILLF